MKFHWEFPSDGAAAVSGSRRSACEHSWRFALVDVAEGMPGRARRSSSTKIQFFQAQRQTSPAHSGVYYREQRVDRVPLTRISWVVEVHARVRAVHSAN